MIPSPTEMAAAQQQALIAQLSNSRYQLGNQLALLVLEALEVWLQLAQTLASPQRAAAKQQLERYFRVMKEAQALAAGLTVVGQLPEDSNGRT